MGTKKHRTRKKKSKRKIFVFRDYSQVDLILGLSYAGLILVVGGFFLFRSWFGEIDFSAPNPTPLDRMPEKPRFEVRPPTPDVPGASGSSARGNDIREEHSTEQTPGKQDFSREGTNETSRGGKTVP